MSGNGTRIDQLRRIAVAMMLAATLVTLGGPAPRGHAQTDACPEPNDDAVRACRLGGGVVIQSFIERPGDVDGYRFVVGDEGAQVSLDLTDLPADYDLYLADPYGGLYGQSVQEGTASEHVQATLLRGAYYVYVQADPAREVDTSTPYTLGLTMSPTTRDGDLAATDSRVLLRDAFDDVTQAMLPVASRMPDLFTVGYVSGEYRVINNDPSGRFWGPVLPGEYEHTILSLRARLNGEAAGRAIALGCRRELPTGDPTFPSMYRVHIYPSTRQFEILRWDGRTRVPLLLWRSAQAIRPDTEWNQIDFGCVNDTIDVRVNGEALASVRDLAHQHGALVLGVVSTVPEQHHAELVVDDLTVRVP